MAISYLDNLVKQKQRNIESWFAAQVESIRMPLFTSTDIRNSGFKMAHVDSNLFPAGFNNLSTEGGEHASKSFKSYIQKYYPDAKKLILVPENFTRNLKYLENVLRLKDIIHNAGIEVVIGVPFAQGQGVIQIDHTKYFEVVPLKSENKVVMTHNNWVADVILLNNDLTVGLPEILIECKQPIIPNPKYGWYKRRKHKHFEAYKEVIEEFAREFEFDSWLLSTYFESCGKISFREKKGLECLAEAVDRIIAKVALKYREHEIKIEPYAFIKADMGTYGMGMMTARSGEEILKINKKHRHGMQRIKHGVHNNEVIVQEGLPTIETYNGFPAESLIYVVDGQVVENIVRWNEVHDERANLNSHGMMLSSNETQSYYLKSIIARLAALAVSKEKL